MRIKICCIMSGDELRAALDNGVSAVGFVSAMPSGPGIIDDSTIRDLARAVPSTVESFLLTSRRLAADIVQHWRFCGTTTVQVCRPLASPQVHLLRSACGKAKLVHVVHVTGGDDVRRFQRVSDAADEVLLDSGRLKGPVIEFGGTGRPHDWSLAHRLRAKARVPVWLAGGLNAANVGAAIRAVRPDGVDVCSGVRTNGRLDVGKLKEFVDEVSRQHARVDLPSQGTRDESFT